MITIQRLTMENINAFVDHMARHLPERGIGGVITQPFSTEEPIDLERIRSRALTRWQVEPGNGNWESIWGLFDHARVVGHVELVGHSLPSLRHRCRLSLGIEEAFRSQGHGRSLISQALQWARKQDFLDWVDLDVFCHNQVAIQLYESMGFKIVGLTPDRLRVDGVRIDDFHMVLPLERAVDEFPIVSQPIGFVKCTRREAIDDNWDDEMSSIELLSKIPAEALIGLQDFSHVEILFYMNQNRRNNVTIGARHPRNNSAWPKIGIFAQRAKNRPNFIGSTVCKIQRVEDRTLHVKGLDAIDGTPVLDIKPWLTELGPRGDVKQPKWTRELMEKYW